MEELMRLLSGMKDSRGPQGIAARGANIYNGTSNAAHRGGGPQFGRPRNIPPEVLQRRLQQLRGGNGVAGL